MTLDAAKSSWTFIDKENFNDRIKNTIKEGSLTVTNNGNHNYTVTGTLRGASDTGQETAIKIDFTGTVPFNNYSTPPAPEAPKATMTVGDLYYNGDNVFFLGLKDGSPIKRIRHHVLHYARAHRSSATRQRRLHGRCRR